MLAYVFSANNCQSDTSNEVQCCFNCDACCFVDFGIKTGERDDSHSKSAYIYVKDTKQKSITAMLLTLTTVQEVSCCCCCYYYYYYCSHMVYRAEFGQSSW